MGRPAIKMIGRKFEKLLVLRRVKDRFNGKKKRHNELWYLVKCDCGKKFETRGYMLRHGRIRGCGKCNPKGGNLIHGLSETKEYQMWNSVKTRAEEEGKKFTLKPSDIKIPKICPLLGIPILANNKKTAFNSPSIDRIDNNKGYVKENIWIVSHKANAMKSSASLTELQTLVKNLEKKLWHISI